MPAFDDIAQIAIGPAIIQITHGDGRGHKAEKRGPAQGRARKHQRKSEEGMLHALCLTRFAAQSRMGQIQPARSISTSLRRKKGSVQGGS